MKRKGLVLFPLILILVCSYAVMHVRAPGPVISIDPVNSTGTPGGTFVVNVNIAGAVNVYAWGVKISFERDLLDVVDAVEGPFFAGYPQGSAFAKAIFPDYLDAGCTILGAWPGKDGSGTLMTVTFEILDAGTTSLHFFESKLIDATPADPPIEIPHNVEDGYFATDAAASLVQKSAWPEHHHFDISVQQAKDGNANQSLFAKVRNVGPLALDVYVAFEVVRDNGVIEVLGAVTTLAPGETQTLNATLELDPTYPSPDTGKYAASASVYYTYYGTYWAQGDKIKTFSFAVVD